MDHKYINPNNKQWIIPQIQNKEYTLTSPVAKKKKMTGYLESHVVRSKPWTDQVYCIRERLMTVFADNQKGGLCIEELTK